jgi:hypothetical protein
MRDGTKDHHPPRQDGSGGAWRHHRDCARLDRSPGEALRAWPEAGITSAALFRSVRNGGKVGDRLTDQSVADIIKAQAERVGLHCSPVTHCAPVSSHQPRSAAPRYSK